MNLFLLEVQKTQPLEEQFEELMIYVYILEGKRT